MKHSISFRGLILTILLTCCNAVWAYDIEVDGIYYNITSTTDLTVEVTRGNNEYSGEIVIPSTITYKSRTFTVTHIGGLAFYSCTGLRSIVIPNSIASFGDSAFSYCRAIRVYINDLAAWCNVDFEEFDSNPLNGRGCLYLNGELVTELIIPDGITEIKNYTFAKCSELKNVVIPNSVTSIGTHAFFSCLDLTSVVIGNSVTSIGYCAFYGCSGLTSVEIPNSVTSIESEAFSGCSGLTSIEIPNSITNIRYGMFSGCSGLTRVEIPNCITSIEENVFSGCSALENIYVMAETPPSISSSSFTNGHYINAVLYVPTGCWEAYQNTDVWKEFWEIKEFDTTGISDVKTENKKETTIYDINGRVVENPANGIYIVDGKKVLLR